MSLWEKFGIAVSVAICSSALITSVVVSIGMYGIRKGWWKE